MNHHKTGMGGPVDVAGLNGEELVKKLQNDFASAENYEYLVQRVTKVENYIGDITSKVNTILSSEPRIQPSGRIWCMDPCSRRYFKMVPP